MTALRIVIIALAVIVAGWLTFDGTHALMTGDYVTPNSGEYAGQLGPWSKLVSALGIPPRSTTMKLIHVGIGMAWLAVIVCYAARARWAWRGMIVCAVCGLWYLPFGTLLGAIQIVLLLLPAVRAAASPPEPKT